MVTCTHDRRYVIPGVVDGRERCLICQARELAQRFNRLAEELRSYPGTTIQTIDIDWSDFDAPAPR